MYFHIDAREFGDLSDRVSTAGVASEASCKQASSLVVGRQGIRARPMPTIDG
jgi:hypothetical protein